MRLAFTLAEVLITLGIIGVVAAITVPGLVSACNKHIVETRLKTVHSTVLQALKMAQAQNGDFSISNNLYDESDVNGYSWASSKDTFETYFAPVFNASTRYGKNVFNNIYSADGSVHVGLGGYYYFVLLNNGVVLGFMKNSYDGFRLTVILNPQKQKLLTGRDVFELQYMSDTYGNGYAYNSILKRNYSISNRQKYIEACKSGSSHPMYAMTAREFCGFLIVENGFKVPKDYPIKL